MSSCVGLAFSAILYLLVLGYATSRLLVLFGDGNPSFSTYEVESESSLEHKVNLDKFGFQVAFKVEKIEVDETHNLVHDANYVDFAVYIRENDGS